MIRPAPAPGMPDTTRRPRFGDFSAPKCRIPEWRALMKMIKALVKKFKKDEDLANHAWVLHVI
ncbi:hypothetical protein ACFRAR_02430 [Kitasatospora sp. NPDC056651]|uniref:hypothetical protein n=1 Tax=Kitasatospora sp. NPDC056651 TaxID=3345892 RepID=UPI0036BF1B02